MRRGKEEKEEEEEGGEGDGGAISWRNKERERGRRGKEVEF